MNNFNAATQHVFSAANQAHLDDHKMLHGLTSDEWAGFRQWQQLGRKISGGKGCGCKIYIVVPKKTGQVVNGEEESKNVLKGITVFNLEHTELMDS